MLSSEEVAMVVEDLKRATTCVIITDTVDIVLDRVTDDVCKIIEQIERANQNAFYRSPYEDSATPKVTDNG